MTKLAQILGCIMMLAAATAQGAPREPDYTGASLAWTSDEPAVRAARELLAGGRFADAEAAVQASTSRDADELRQIIRRLRWEYDLDEPGLLAKLRPSIRDICGDDLARWRDARQLQWRRIDGRVAYFRREPSNLFRFCDEARRRRDPATLPPQPKFVTDKHLAEVIQRAESDGRTDVLPVRHRVRYSLSIPPGHPAMKPGALVRCWLPFPQQHPRQRGIRLLSTWPQNPTLAPPGSAHQTLYLEQRITQPDLPIIFRLSFEFTSSAYYPLLDDAKARPLPATWSGGCLSQRPPHIVFSPQLRQAVAQALGNETNPLAKARRIFEFVHSQIHYCAEEEYCLIPGFSEKALQTRRGDCGIQATLFIAMCRCAGIPARWQSGWETRPGLENMHDWAEFYVEPWGWLPADPSYGLRHSDDPKVRWFYFGHQDSYRLIVNTDYGHPLHPAKPSLRSEPADFQRGEVEIDGINLYFNEWDWQMDVECEPG